MSMWFGGFRWIDRHWRWFVSSVLSCNHEEVLMAGLEFGGLDRYMVRGGSDLSAVLSCDTSDHSLFPGSKEDGQSALKSTVRKLKELQSLLWAEHRNSLLIVLQGLDTAGKDGVIRKVFGPLNPQGVKVSAFKQPTQEELDHDFLWRIHRQTPGAGEITVFNRSHYEDVLVVRVHGLVGPEKCRERYRSIREFERILINEGTTVVKFFLNIGKEEQKARLQARLDNPDKHWKFNPSDLKERSLWEDYRKAYAEAVIETSTEDAPWYCVPSDRKWYRDLVIAGVIMRKLEFLGMKYPEAPEGLDKVVIV